MRDEFSRRNLCRLAGLATVGVLVGCGSGSTGSNTDGSSGEPTEDVAVPNGVEPTESKPDGPESITTTEVRRQNALQTTIPPNNGGGSNLGGLCGNQAAQPDEEPGSVSIWHSRSGAGEALLTQTGSRWERASESSFSATRLPGSEMEARLQSSIGQGEGPLLFEWPHDRAARFDEQGLLSDQSGDISIPDCLYSDWAEDVGTVNGKQVGVPWAAETVAMYYNTDLVDEPPETYADMQAIMEEIEYQNNDNHGLAMPLNPYFVSGFAQAYGKKIYDGETDSLALTSDEVQQGLRLVFEDLAAYMPNSISPQDQFLTFSDGNAAFYISGPWRIFHLNDNSLNWEVSTLPELPGGGILRPYAGVDMLYFSAAMEDSSNAGAARDFVKWFTTNNNLMTTAATQAGYLPLHQGIDERAMDETVPFRDQLETSIPIPQDPKMEQVWRPLGNALTETFNGNGELETNLETAEQEIRDAWSTA